MRPHAPVRIQRGITVGAIRLIIAVLLALPAAQAKGPASVDLDRGFQRLYDLDFPGAQKEFESWEKLNLENPMGPVSEAAGILFSEFDRLGVLEAQFYQDDSAFAARQKYRADPSRRALFDQRLASAEALARQKLSRDSGDRDALLAMTLVAGLRADYAALIEKRNLASLHFTKESSAWAQQLLAADPACYDAYLAGGISNYIVGSMAAPMRWLLRIGGVSGDRAGGIAQLQTVARQGRLLAPFARILLAIAYVREKDVPRARGVLVSLQTDFPDNPLFGRELARLDNPPGAK
ncbi:MAG: hypothetical protein ACHP8B_16665 [Terriglobales bacterium]